MNHASKTQKSTLLSRRPGPVRSLTQPCWVLVLVILFGASSLRAEGLPEDVRGVLEKHCFACHGPEKQKSKIRFDTLSTDLIQDRAAGETWHDALDAIHLGEMPPEDEPPLSSEERRLLTGWIQNQIDEAVAALKSTGSRVVIRRLNRVEYQNTMVDLLGVDLDYISNLPPDSVSKEGFQNNGAALTMSPLQLEYYLESARKGLRHAIVTGSEPEIHSHISKETAADKRGNFSNRVGRANAFVARMEEFPDNGEFEIRVRARAELVEGKGYPRMKVRFGYRADTQTPAEDVGMVDVVSEEPTEFVFRQRIERFPIQSRTQSKYPGMLAWVTNVYDDGEEFASLQDPPPPKDKKKKRKAKVYVEDPNFPKIVIESFEFVAPVHSSWPPQHHREILFESSSRSKDERAYAAEVVSKFMERAFRRPVKEEEVALFLRFFEKIRPTVDQFETAISETLAMVLISPEFLYLVEPGGEEKRDLSEFELASRLSYFLWSTMPDEALLKKARDGKLSNPAIRKKEIARMLKDPRSERFVTQFTNQWLDLSSVDRVAVNPEYYEDFDVSLKVEMQKETRAFFSEILRKDLSALNFLESDFVMVNEPMARHYGISDGPRGTAFERTSLAGADSRGGLLTQASILLGNSTGEDSHPILRAVWLRERLLDDPPAPPPPNVPELNGESPDMAKLSVKQQLEAHREDPSCADCHKGIDPWGVAMENFDAIGQWREKIRRKDLVKKRRIEWEEIPVDAKANLPDGEIVQGMADLKQYLVEQKSEAFARALTARMTSYALGRDLEFTDEEIVDKVAEDFVTHDFRLSYLIQRIAGSELFFRK